MPRAAFISWVESLAAFTPDNRAETQLKLAALYHPKIFLPVSTDMVQSVSEEISKDAGVSIGAARELFKSVHEIEGFAKADEILSICCTPEDAYTWDKSGKIRRGLRGAVKRSLANASDISLSQLNRKMKDENGYAWIREATYTAVAATGAANAWRQLNHVLPCDLICFNEATNFAAKSRIYGEVSKADGALIDTLEVIVPSVNQLGWDHVFELRVNRHVDAFRNWVANHDGKSAPDILDALWSAFAEIVPSTKGTILKGIASNIPLPTPVNPVSLIYAAQDIKRSALFQKKHGVTIFFHDIWNYSSRNT